jgi:hypothetical protein
MKIHSSRTLRVAVCVAITWTLVFQANLLGDRAELRARNLRASTCPRQARSTGSGALHWEPILSQF